MITKHDAMTCGEFYHVTLRNADGTAVRCRATGQCKVWVTRPDDFRLPVKYGLRESFYITPANAHEWSVVEPADDPPVRQVPKGMSWQQAHDEMGTRANVVLGNDTQLGWLGKDYGVFLHGSLIVRIRRNGTRVLDSCGYMTEVTKRRIMDYAGASLFKARGKWYVARHDLLKGRQPRTHNSATYKMRFYDGMVVDQYGNPLEVVSADEARLSPDTPWQVLRDWLLDAGRDLEARTLELYHGE